MPKQSTHVAGYIAPFSLCKIYRSNITNNSCLMSPVPPLSPQSVLLSSLVRLSIYCIGRVPVGSSHFAKLRGTNVKKKKKVNSFHDQIHLYGTWISFYSSIRILIIRIKRHCWKVAPAVRLSATQKMWKAFSFVGIEMKMKSLYFLHFFNFCSENNRTRK